MTTETDRRCDGICGTRRENCFIYDANHLACISDMVINKTFSMTTLIEAALENNKQEDVSLSLKEALGIAENLFYWIKYLQVAKDIHETWQLWENAKPKEWSNDERYFLLNRVKEYMALQLELPTGIELVIIRNFRKNDIQFISSTPLTIGENIHCLISSNCGSFHKEVSFDIKIKYCKKKKEKEEYIVGSCVIENPSHAALDFFNNVFLRINELWPAEDLFRHSEGAACRDESKVERKAKAPTGLRVDA